MLKAFLRELFPKVAVKSIEKGSYIVINVKSFYEKTGYLLKSGNPNIKKARPLIAIEQKKETIKFVATTTNLFTRRKRPKISLKDCQVNKDEKECFGINPKRKYVWLFAKKTSNRKRWRFFYEVDIYTIEELIEEDKLRICGKCKGTTIKEIKEKIENFGEYL